MACSKSENTYQVRVFHSQVQSPSPMPNQHSITLVSFIVLFSISNANQIIHFYYSLINSTHPIETPQYITII